METEKALGGRKNLAAIIAGQLFGPDGIEEAMVSAGWREQGDYSADTIGLLYYLRSWHC